MALPSFFYELQGRIHLEGFPHAPRWYDSLSENSGGEERKILTPIELEIRADRDATYANWLNQFKGHKIKPKMQKFQAVRIVGRDHPFASARDWWHEFTDCVFRVYMQPHTAYSDKKGEWLQYYILCPEDTYLVHCYNRHKQGHPYPPRGSFRWISPHKDLRKLLLIPQECAPHCRHETTAGELPQGL